MERWLACKTSSYVLAAVVRNAIRHLPVHDFASLLLMGHGANIARLALHPTQPYALTLDTLGRALLWGTEGLAAKRAIAFDGRVSPIPRVQFLFFKQVPETQEVVPRAAEIWCSYFPIRLQKAVLRGLGSCHEGVASSQKTIGGMQH